MVFIYYHSVILEAYFYGLIFFFIYFYAQIFLFFYSKSEMIRFNRNFQDNKISKATKKRLKVICCK